jgi:ParB/RepB/Spo0J family partition protein
MPNEAIHSVPLKDIELSDENVRRSEPEKELQELADNIRRHGQLQPVLLIGEWEKPPYRLIVGQRRFRAHRDILKAKQIKATFVEKMSETEAKICSLAENMCRVQLTYKDAADAVTALYKVFGRDDRRVARETGLSLRKVRQYVYVRERASPKMKRMLDEGEVKPVDVQRALRAASDDIHKADELLDRMKDYDKYRTKRVVDYGQDHPRASAREILARAAEPVVERQLLVKLSDKARDGLAAAAKRMSMEPDEVAARAVEEWLSTQGFI